MVPVANHAFALFAKVLNFMAPAVSGGAFLKCKTHEELQQVTRVLVKR